MSNQFVSRRSLLSGALWLTAGGLLAACGGQPAAPTAAPAKPAAEPTKPAAAEPTKPAAAPAAATPTAAPAAKPAAGGVTKVVVWAGDLATADESTPTGKWAKWIRTTFQEKNPKYEVDAQDKGWDQALRTGLLTAIAGNAVPDITTGEAFVHEFAALGAFNVVPDLPIKHFAYGPVAGSIYQGQLYGVPIRTSPFALETNKRTAEQAGLDPTKPPKTWDELVANSEKAKAAGGDKFVGFNLYGPAPNRIYGTVLRTIPWINQTGKPLGDDDGTKAFMNSPEHVAAYELSRKLFKTADPGNTFSGDEGKLYAYLWQDKAVYQVSATWNIFNSIDNKAESLFHPLPRKDPNVSGNVVLGNEVYSSLKKAKNQEGAFAVQKFMADPETQKQAGVVLGTRLPTVASVLQDPNLEKLPAYAPAAVAIRTFADILLKEDVKPVPPYSKNPDKVWIAWGDAFGKILQSSDPIQPILDRLQADVEKLIK
jgi:ABC-type glycerol-3-phosphate transport system substrate-binding protein